MLTFEDFINEERVTGHTITKETPEKISASLKTKVKSAGGTVHHHSVGSDGTHKVVHSDKSGKMKITHIAKTSASSSSTVHSVPSSAEKKRFSGMTHQE